MISTGAHSSGAGRARQVAPSSSPTSRSSRGGRRASSRRTSVSRTLASVITELRLQDGADGLRRILQRRLAPTVIGAQQAHGRALNVDEYREGFMAMVLRQDELGLDGDLHSGP